MEISKENIQAVFSTVARKDTSADPENCTQANPLWGHCAVASLVAQDYLGGSLMRGSLKEVERYAYLRSHYWNQLVDGTLCDFTSEQYPDLHFQELEAKERSREEVLKYPDTLRRYELFSQRVKKYVSSGR